MQEIVVYKVDSFFIEAIIPAGLMSGNEHSRGTTVPGWCLLLWIQIEFFHQAFKLIGIDMPLLSFDSQYFFNGVARSVRKLH
jgi:hypothetical protein